ncbi:unnamed protein product, partial [Iphiclides podalirius]
MVAIESEEIFVVQLIVRPRAVDGVDNGLRYLLPKVLIEVVDTMRAYRDIDSGGGRRAPRTSDATDLPESARAHQKSSQNSDGGACA